MSRSTAADVAVVILLCAVALVPLLRGESPCSHDGGLHYYRVVAIRHALRQGLFFTRWLPDLAFGYGFPFFNYRAPLSYYLALGLHLTGLSLPWALNLVYVLSMLGSALGAYLLGRDLLGRPAGIVAAVAYAYAPYQFLDALVRGNAPESLALALLPFTLWAFRRLALEGGRRWFLASVGLLATLYLGHNISSLLFTPLLLAYLAVLWWVYRGHGHWKQVALAFALTLGLTTFFWLPALAEKGYVQLQLTGATRNNDFHHNFLSLAEVFAPPEALDTSLMNPPLEVKLGLAHAVLAGGGLILGTVLLRGQEGGAPKRWGRARGNSTESQRAREHVMTLLFFAVVAAVFVFMSTSASVWLWEHVPLLPFVQFPWRFVGRATLPVSLLAGATCLSLAGRPVRSEGRTSPFMTCVLRLLPSAVVAAMVLAALPATYPPKGYCPAKPHPMVQDVHHYERSSGLAGVDPVGAYFPIWVQQRPQGSPLEAQYGHEGPVARFDASALPQGAQIVQAEYGPNRARVVIESPSPFRARYLSFHFPGWRASVDGERVATRPSDPEGLITFDVPPGRHELIIRFGETPLRRVTDVVSAFCLVLLLIYWSWPVSRRLAENSRLLGIFGSVSPATTSVGQLIPDTSEVAEGKTGRGRRPVRPGYLWLLSLTAAALLAFRLAVVDRTETPFRHAKLTEDGSLPGIAHPLNQPYADGLMLMGYEQSATEMPADDALRIDLHWTVRRQPSRRYQTVVHLVGPEGLRWSPSGSYRPTDYEGAPPTYTWSPGQHALDSHEVEPLPGTPPGTYDVVLTVFDRETLTPLSVLNDQLQPAAPELTLGQVTLGAPRSPPQSEELDIRERFDASFGPLMLLGADFDRAEAAVGDPVFLTTFWRLEEQSSEGLALRLELLTAEGSVAARYDLPVVASWYPTRAWSPGFVWRGQQRLYLPATLESGSYTWRFSVSSLPYTASHPSGIDVRAPRRTSTAPPVDIEVGVRLGDLATLLGANVEPEPLSLQPGASLKTTLVWRAESQTETSYHVFLHLIDSSEKLVAQSDGVPADWNRPTTGWVAGEVITDPHTLSVPESAAPGSYTLLAGLYVPGRERLPTPDGMGTVPIAVLTVKTP